MRQIAHIVSGMKVIKGSEIPFIAAAHEDPIAPGALKRVLLKKDDLQNGQFQMLNWAKIPAGKSFALHYHEDMQEVFLMINGHATMTIGAETAALTRGDCVVVPIRAAHTMKNTGSEDLEYIVFGISTGAGGKTVVIK